MISLSQFKRIPRIPNSKELEDLIFSQLKKIKVEAPKGAKKRRSDYSFYKTLYFRQFRVIFPDLEERLQKIVDYFPIMDNRRSGNFSLFFLPKTYKFQIYKI